MSALDGKPMVEVHNREAWRAWLEANHATSGGVWMVTARARKGAPVGLDYEAAVEEALCVGWVDSTAGVVDDERGKIYFAPRKAKSPWAASNKARVERLIASGRMQPAGLAVIDQAKANGYWTILDSVERLEMPADLVAALDGAPPAPQGWAAWPPSVRKQQLAQIAYAVRPETRAQRIAKATAFAQRGERPPS